MKIFQSEFVLFQYIKSSQEMINKADLCMYNNGETMNDKCKNIYIFIHMSRQRTFLTVYKRIPTVYLDLPLRT